MKVFNNNEAMLLAKTIHEQRKRNRESIKSAYKDNDLTSAKCLEKENLDLHTILQVIWEATEKEET